MANVAEDDDTLSTFLRRKKDEALSIHVDWKAKRDEWIASIEALYQLLTQDLLKDLIDDKTVEVSWATKQITEEYIGTYTLRELILKIGNEQVVFSPKALNVIGAAGRIDIRGAVETIPLLREKPPDNSSVQWRMVQQRVPKLIKRSLDSDSLKWALKHVML